MKRWICQLNQVCFQYPNQKQILKNLDLNIEEGSCVAILGASGCGKSTLAQILAGFLTPTSGSCTWNFPHFTKPEELFQQKQLIFQDPSSSLTPFYTPYKTVYEILKLHQLQQPDLLKDKAKELLEKFGIFEKIHHKKNALLSGGEKQRLTLARAFSVNPRFLILDEPLSSCDPFLQKEILHLIKHTIAEKKLTVATVLHDLNHALFLADRICLLKDGQIEAFEDKHLFLNQEGSNYKRSFIEAFF